MNCKAISVRLCEHFDIIFCLMDRFMDKTLCLFSTSNMWTRQILESTGKYCNYLTKTNCHLTANYEKLSVKNE